jgi:hypothetical protein
MNFKGKKSWGDEKCGSEPPINEGLKKTYRVIVIVNLGGCNSRIVRPIFSFRKLDI